MTQSQAEKAYRQDLVNRAQFQLNQAIDAKIKANRAWEESTASNRAEAIEQVKEAQKNMKLWAEIFKVCVRYQKSLDAQ